ncbi:MAG TPA: SAM-dependent methyltransferase [Vicinamibacterales bacterium]
MRGHRGPSRTAQRVALRRAAHQLLDAPLVFADPLALRIIGADDERLLTANPSHFDATAFDRGLRAFAAARSRLVEDRLAEAIPEGLSQLVVLGAGLDTFAYRNPYEQLRVFEVDHPDTQAWKRARLETAGIAVPPSVSYVPVDFATDDAFDALGAAGFRDDEPSAFSWLGVVTYLTLDAVRSTLRRIASLPRGSFVVFDYAISRDLLAEHQRAILDEAAARVAAIGEPFVTFFHPHDLDGELREAAFSNVEQLGPAELNARYFSGRTDDLRAGGMAWIACATV